jgi:hypothetical protein
MYEFAQLGIQKGDACGGLRPQLMFVTTVGHILTRYLKDW